MLPETSFVRKPLFSFLLLLCAVAIAYTNSFWGVFQFDDYNVIVNNPRIHSWSAWWQDLQHGIRPLLKFTYSLDWSIGLGAPGFHLTNVLIHLCNTFLVFALTHHFAAAHTALKKLHSLPLLVALLFALHPAHTEAVTYISGRSSALMTLFYLAGMLAYVTGKSLNNKIFLHGLTPLCMLLALAVKETAVTFPAALLLWELHSGGTIKTAIRNQWTSWLLLLISAIFFLLHGGYQRLAENSAAINTLYGNLATQTLAFSYMLRQWLLPLWLNIDPDLRVLHNFAGLMPQLAILFFCVIIIFLSINRRPWLSFAFSWALLHLFMLYIFLPRLDVANDRQLYIASWPLALAFVAEMSLWLAPKLFRISMVMLLLVLTGLTVLRNDVYHSEIALWQATALASPDKARVQNNLGYAYMLEGKNDEARGAFITALQLDPNYSKARYNLLQLNQ